MKFRLPPLGLLLALAAVTAAAQSTEPAAPPATPTPKGRLPEIKRSDKTARSVKGILPDPDLLDGSSYDKEKRPLHGMLSEIEMGESEGGKSGKISPDAGPAGGSPPPPDLKAPTPSSGGAPPPPSAASTPPPENAAGGAQSEASDASGGAGGNSKSAPPGGPAAAAEGAQAQNLKVPEGAAGAGAPDGTKPRDMQIGDASLQIQTAPQNSANVVGTQGSSSQQYEKKLPSGGSPASGSSNAGVEKGRVVPKGL